MDAEKKAALIAKFSEFERLIHKRYLDSVVAGIIERAQKKPLPTMLS
jgi:hypothetical protein